MSGGFFGTIDTSVPGVVYLNVVPEPGSILASLGLALLLHAFMQMEELF